MYAVSLQSGSNGNCIYVETESARVLIDAGISGIQAETRLRSFGRDIRDVDCVLISHDHSDHVRCAAVYSRKYSLDLWMTPRTYRASRSRGASGRFHSLSHFEAGESIRVGDTVIDTIPTPHDGVDGATFIIDDGHRRLGVLTDLGHVYDGLQQLIDGLDAVFIESNYDVDMLEKGPYPAFLKKRISGSGGHISNIESARLLESAFRKKLKWAALSHLSGENNSPRIAIETHRAVLGGSVELCVASRYGVSELLSI